MCRPRLNRVCCYAAAFFFAFVGAARLEAQTVWSGLSFTFTKSNGSDAILPANQDRITPNVWITRDSAGRGLLNAATECDPIDMFCSYTSNFSPEDTEWATARLPANSDETIAAANWQNLDFTDWQAAYGNSVGNLILDPVYRNAVVHLITDDIYLDLRFTAWTIGPGGGFSYIRAVAPGAVQPTGDYNDDGVVDAADYVLWRKTFNQPTSPAGTGADGDASGTVDGPDYTFWRERFGNTVPGSGGNSSPVPEPSSATIALLGLLVTHVFRRRKLSARHPKCRSSCFPC